MAVDIPVVIDIDKAFAEAAAKVPKAMAPLESSINKLNDRLAKANDNLNKYKIVSKNWEKAAKEVQLVAQAIETANEQFDHFASNGGSIKQMSNDLAALRRRWEEMGAKQKFDSKGNLSAEAQQLISCLLYTSPSNSYLTTNAFPPNLKSPAKLLLRWSRRRSGWLRPLRDAQS